jgi:hypothetical protein
MLMNLIFGTIDELREYAPRLTVSRFDVVREYVANATQRRVAPAMGALYGEVAGYVAGGGSGSTPLDRLAPYVKRVVAYYAMLDFIRAGGTLITAQGVQKAETETHKSSSYGDKMDTLNYYAEEADGALDALLAFLDGHRASYPGYSPGDAFALIPSPEVYGRYVNIGGSRRTYHALLPELRNAEQLLLLPLLKDDLADRLRRYADGDADALNGTAIAECAGKALEYARAAVANAAMHRAMPLLTLRCRDGAVGVASFYSPSAQERAALMEVLDKLSAQVAAAAGSFAEQLENLLQAPEASKARLLANSAESKHCASPFF